MKKYPLPAPLKYHETMDVHDPSKIQSFQECPRGYFFAYVLGLRKDESNVHLVFGSAWHEAMEHIMNHGYTVESVEEAFNRFLELYREGFPDENTDTARAPKNPEFALKALIEYVKYWRNEKFETLFTEVSASVPISPDRTLHMKLDSILRDGHGFIRSREHKTASRNTASYREKWAIMLQPSAYTHLLKCLFPEDNVYGVEINTAVFTKTKGAEFLRIPIQKTNRNMQRFLFDVNHWMDQIEWNFEMLSKCTADDPVMTAFPCNGTSCSHFGCRFPGLCTAWDNPLAHIGKHLPSGYKIEFWDPRRDIEAESKFKAEPDATGKVAITKIERKEDNGEEN